MDDTPLLDDEFLEDLRLSTNFELDGVDPLTPLLVGLPSLQRGLRKPVHCVARSGALAVTVGGALARRDRATNRPAPAPRWRRHIRSRGQGGCLRARAEHPSAHQRACTGIPREKPEPQATRRRRRGRENHRGAHEILPSPMDAKHSTKEGHAHSQQAQGASPIFGSFERFNDYLGATISLLGTLPETAQEVARDAEDSARS